MYTLSSAEAETKKLSKQVWLLLPYLERGML